MKLKDTKILNMILAKPEAKKRKFDEVEEELSQEVTLSSKQRSRIRKK